LKRGTAQTPLKSKYFYLNNMFEDQNPNQNTPQNLPTEPVDMYAGIEGEAGGAPAEHVPDALDAGLLKKKMPGGPVSAADLNSAMQPQVYQMKEPVLGKVILTLVVIAVLAGLGIGGWWVYNNMLKQPAAGVQTTVPAETQIPSVETQTPAAEITPTTVPSAEIPAETATATEAAPTSTITEQMNNDNILFGESIDTDKDGLPDVREKELGTNPAIPDTDADGLSDGDEILVWKTDPLNPDTDGDGYADGTEVRNGYSPLGPGKLFVQPTTTATSTL
jgi:hypothetical protein